MRPLPARVLEARNANEALAVLGRESPSIVVSDYEMPGMNGARLIALIRSRWPQIRCVLHSGYGFLPPLEPQVRVLVKPYPPDAFLSVLRALLAELEAPLPCV